jgi:hypothetical protein
MKSLTPGNIPGPNQKYTSRDALKHVLDKVFCLPDDSGLRNALQAGGYFRLSQVLSMSQAIMKALHHKAYVDGKVIYIGILPVEEGLLQALQGFAAFTETKLGRILTPAAWLLVTEYEFDAFQGSSHWRMALSVTPMSTSSNGDEYKRFYHRKMVLPMPTGSNVMPTPAHIKYPSVPPPFSEVPAFNRGIKSDQSLFPVFKQEKDWNGPKHRLHIQATAQRVDNVPHNNHARYDVDWHN